MSRFLLPVTNWYHARAAREKLMLLGLIPVVVLVIALLVLMSFWRAQAEQGTLNQELLKEYQWLQTEATDIGQWREDFGRQKLGLTSSGAELGTLLQQSLSRYRLKGDVTRTEQGWKIQFGQADGDKLLQYIEAAVGSGAIPRQINLTRLDEKGGVSGFLVMEALVP